MCNNPRGTEPNGETIGNLENECQSTEMIFNLKRHHKSLQDFYAILEKEKSGKIGMTNIIKKFISELPEDIKTNVQRKFMEYRRTTPAGEIPIEHVEDLYVRARQLYSERYNKSECTYNVSKELNKQSKLEMIE